MIDVSVAGPDDADLLMRLERASSQVALAHVFGPDRPYPDDDVRARWQLVLEDPSVVTLLGWDAGEAVAFAAVDHVELRHFGVAPDRFGTGLADYLHTEVRRRMPGGLQLWVLEQNVRARHFYERNGWAPDGRTGTSEFPPYPVEVGYSIA